MSSGRFAEVRTPIILSILMVLMTQVGYLDLMNAWSGDEETLMDAETLFETVGQGSANYSLAQSTEGEALALNAAMDPITFGYVEGEDASTIRGNDSYWNITEAYSSWGYGDRISQLDGHEVVFDDDVIMFNHNNDLYMHNLNNGTTWKELTHSGGFTTFLYVIDDVLLFDSYVSYYVRQLWAYNTSNGTAWRVGGAGFELPSFTLNSNTFNPSPLRVGDDLYLYGEDTNGPGEGLYRFNGTSLELEFLSNSTSPSTSFTNLKNLIHHNGTVYFTAKEFGTYRWELYKHTIATNQTRMLHDVTGGSTSSSNYGFQAQVTMVSDDIIVFGYSGLWAYNITSNTSYQVNSSLGGNLNEAVVVDDVVYFSAGVDRELYAYNLSTNATWMVKNINTNNGKDGLISNEGPDILVRDGKLYFIGLTGWQDVNINYQIWVHDTQENATYSIDNGFSYGRGASWFHGFTRDQLFYYYDASSGYDSVRMYDISTNETSYILRQGSGSTSGQYWAFMDDVFVYQNKADGKMYAYSPEELSVVSFDAVVGASCSISPSLPAGLSLNQGNCTVSGTPTTITSQTSYTLTATISGQTYGATFWLITDYLPLTPSVADLDATVGAPIEPITFGIPTGAKAGDGGYDAPYNSNYSTMLAGDYHSCALLGDGSMACWGDNQYGQLGDGTTTSSSTPVPVNLPAGSSVASIPAYAADHSCAILDNGSVYCWGLGSAFSAGSSVSTPQHLPLPAGRTPVSIEADHHSTCVILDNGSMMCVGGNTYNRLGYNGSATGTFAYVEYLPQGAIVVDMSLSENSACALLDDGDVWCWGYNSYEALGVSGGGTTYNYAVQPSIPSGNITAIEGHVRGHCSLYDNGSVACWGSNSNGERGIGNSSSANLATLGIQFTQPMPGNLPVTSIATGDHTVCAQLSNGSVACWADYYANGYTSDTHTPTLIPWPHGSVQAKAVSVGWYHGCALLENGSMWCWGQNSYGQLGDGTTTHSVSGTFVDLDQGVRGPPVNMSGATCSVDPALPAGLSMTQGNCTISGTPTGLSSTTTYTVYANTSAGTSRSEISITVVASSMFPSVDGAQLWVDQAMTNITFHYDANAASGSSSGSIVGPYNGNGTAWMVRDLNPYSSTGTNPSYFTAFDNTLYFSGYATNAGTELMKSDGTSSGTTMVKDIYSGSPSSSPSSLTVVDNSLYFRANDGTNGSELWKTDGTASGTVMVKDIHPSGSGNPGQFIAVGNTVFFYANDGTNGYELWKSDGTTSGTVMVKDIRSGSGGGLDFAGYTGTFFAAVGNTVYFHATDGTNGRELWKSDGTASGTVMVKDIRSGSYGSDPAEFLAIGDTVYFVANDGTNGKELWKSDGTASGTVMVKDICSGCTYESPSLLTAAGNALYFTADDGTNGRELWKSDGTSSGTVMIKDINSGNGHGSPVALTVAGNALYFTADDGTNGRELWKSDGTASGTMMVKDIDGASTGSAGYETEAVGNTVYFSANDGTSGAELWKSDGTASGTVMVQDSNSGSGSSWPNWFEAVGTSLYFRANDGTNGQELWALDPANIMFGSSITGATCSISPSLPAGLSIDSSTCTISGTPTVETSNTTYTVTANISNVTYQGSVWLSTSAYGNITSTVEGAHLSLGETMTPITLNYTVNANATSGSSGGSGSGSSTSSTFAYANNKLAAGGAHTCAILDNGSVSCWGDNLYGQLGHGTHGTLTHKSTPTLTSSLGTGRTAVALSSHAGSVHTCAILDNGDLKCWGRDHYGQLGDGYGGTGILNAPSSTPIDLGPGRTAVAVSAGPEHTCAILDNGDLKCWGRDLYGQLGNGGANIDLYAPSSTPIDLGTGRTAVAVDVGHDHTCAILDNGDLKCWGRDRYGQLGDGAPSTDLNAPPTTAIDLGTGRTAVAVHAGDATTCAILDNGELKCWGADYNGQLGDGAPSTDLYAPSSTPIDLGTGRTAVAVVTSGATTCAILDNGELKCWGRDTYGHLGDGGHGGSGGQTDTYAPPTTAIDLGTGRTAVAVSSGTAHACAILDNGEMKCWGWDYSGQLGDGGTNTNQHSPVSVSGSNTWDATTVAVTWETHPALPAGMSISGGTISGTPSVYAKNQTYTIYANQSGYSTTHELYFSVDTNNPHTVVENQAIDPIGFHPPFNNGTTVWTVSPALPGNLSIDTSTGEITGSVNGTLAETTYTVTATHNGSATETFSFNLRSLADYDGDGLPNDLPGDYDAAEGPTPGLVADSDDDGDGLDDSVETGTGNYVDGTDTGTNPLNPDTDGDGICDGPNAVPGVCVAGPDADPNGAVSPPTLVGVNNTAISTLSPYLAVSGGTYEISPDLPASLTLDANTGEISGTPTQTLANTTFTVWANHSDGTSLSWDFTIEILEDSDGDGLPNQLPGDYDSSNPDSPGLVEDLDDDADGLPDTDEGDTGTSPTNPDTDGDGMCDGINAVPGVCTAGPDAFPLDPSADTDTDGDGMPDTINGNSTSVPPLVEDEDDDGDGLDDVNETGTGIYNSSTDTGTDPLDPDTDNDGICDGPNAVPPICVAGPDETPLGQTAEGTIYALNNSLMVSLTPKYTIPDGTYEIHPALPAGVTIDPISGIISGTPTEVIPETEYTVYGNATAGGLFFTFNLQVLEDTDRDGLPNELPEGYPEDGELVEDLDDDGDGASDLSETGTGIYNGTGDLGTDSLNPDTDGDGICDGPNAVPPICLAGPDSNPVGTGPLGPTVLVNNTETTPINPPNAVPGATWEVSPDLPEGLVFDPATGIITGTPTQAMDNTTYTIWANTTDPAFSIEATFWLQVLEDFDGDGMPDELPDDYPDTGVEPYTLIEDEDDDNDGMSDTNESIIGTNPFNPDTDGDGFCDGDLGVEGVCYAGPDSHPLDPTLPVNTDGDAYPDEDPDGPGGLIADDDDDNDGYLDTTETACNSDPLNATSIPDDMDGDGICDLMDDDMDGDGIENIAELGAPLSTEPDNPDTDGDGVCDGPEAPANGGCVAGPDAFPLDPAGAKDTDNDGKPDTLVPGVTSTSVPPLVEDLDDDNDTWSDFDEGACGTDPLDEFSTPTDTDGDGLCDTLDPYLDLPFTLEYPTQYVDLFVNQTMDPLLPWVNGSGDVVTWELEGELPEGLTFGWSPARDAMMDGSIRGTPTNATETVNLTIWANNSVYSESFSLSLTVFNDSDNDSIPDSLPEGYVGNLTADLDDDNDGLPDDQEIACGSDPLDNESGKSEWVTVCLDVGGGDDDDGVNWMWCFPCLLLLLLLLIIPLLLGRDRLLVLLADGPEPEYTTAEPNFVAGSGTEDDPFILAPVGPLQPGSMESTVEEITITNMGDIKIDMVDFNDEDNYGRFSMYESAFSMEGARVLAVGKDGEVVINFKFDDREFPTYEGGTYTGRIKLGKASVYFLWEVTVMADEHRAKTEKKKTMDRIKKRKKSFDFERIGKATAKNKDDLQAIKGIGPYSEEKLNALGIFTYAQLANFDRKTEDEVNDAIEHYKGRIRRDEWVKQARDIIGAEAKANEEALKAAEEAQAKAEAEAKAAEEAEAAKKAEEAAAAAAAAAAEKEAKEEAAAAKKADAEAKKAAAAAEKEAKEAEKKAKAEADKKAKEEAAAAAAEKEAKEAEKKAKAEADKKAKEEAAAAKKAEEEAKKAAAAKPVTKGAKKEEELKRVKERSKSIDFKVLGTAKASEKDDLQAIKGIGPFIEEKLNALGIYTWLQISKMTDKLEDQVNEAIEFFPGRVKRDQWVNQAKILLGEDVKLDEKALKQAEELARVAAKAESIDFATLGVASASDKDDLKAIKGIGPFIEEKLNALGIYTFEQVSKMTAKIEEEVNVAIEFFPGRVKRDEWAKQAKKLHKDKK